MQEKNSPLQNFCSGSFQKIIPTKTADCEHLRCEKSGITDFAETVNFIIMRNYCELLWGKTTPRL